MPGNVESADARRCAGQESLLDLHGYIERMAQPQPITRLYLETDARDLVLVGKTLFVLGESLAAVDVTDPTAPHEILQGKTVTGGVGSNTTLTAPCRLFWNMS